SATPERRGHRRPADQDRLRDTDPEIQPAATPIVRHADRGDYDPATPLGAGDPRRGSGDRDATGGGLGAGVRRRRLLAPGDALAPPLPTFGGGALRGLVARARRFPPEEAETSPGTLMSTGLIAGGSLAGIIIALLVVFEDFSQKIDFSWKEASGEIGYHLPAIG